MSFENLVMQLAKQPFVFADCIFVRMKILFAYNFETHLITHLQNPISQTVDPFLSLRCLGKTILCFLFVKPFKFYIKENIIL